MAITATVRLAQPGGTAVNDTREFSALPSGLAAMTDWLLEMEVDAALMEGTGIYWEAPFDALADAGITATLVHARQVQSRSRAARPMSPTASGWHGCANSASPVRALCRTGTSGTCAAQCRYRRTLVQRRSQVRTRVQKIIDRAGVRIGGILTDIFGTNGRRILDGLCRGDDRQVILDSLSGHVRGKLEQLGDALTLTLGDSNRLLLVDLMEEFDSLVARERRLSKRIHDCLAPWNERIRLLTTIPGIDEASACAIFAEIGPDLDAFPSADHLAAWAGLCPGNNESGGKRRSGRAVRGNKYLRSTLAECAQGAARTKGCQFQGYHKSLMIRRGYKRAVIATAHKMLRVIHSLLRSGRPYHDPVVNHEELMVHKNAPRWIRMLKEYGQLPPPIEITIAHGPKTVH